MAGGGNPQIGYFPLHPDIGKLPLKDLSYLPGKLAYRPNTPLGFVSHYLKALSLSKENSVTTGDIEQEKSIIGSEYQNIRVSEYQSENKKC